jgi:hypothetical protein
VDDIDGGLLDGGMLDALGQLQELSAGDPVPVMKAKESPLIGSNGGRLEAIEFVFDRFQCTTIGKVNDGPSWWCRTRTAVTCIYC